MSTIETQEKLESLQSGVLPAMPDSRGHLRSLAVGALGGLAVGTLVGMLVSPYRGRDLRRRAADQVHHLAGLARHRVHDLARTARNYRNRATGLAVETQKKLGLVHELELSGTDLANKVRTHLGRIEGLELGNVLVNCVGGVCTLRGGVADVDQRTQVECEVRTIPGVTQVDNRLHLHHLAQDART